MSKIRIRQLKSSIGTKPRQRATLKALGLRRVRHEVVHEESPVILGMLRKVAHLVQVFEEK
jgi:large subunit ribosomal protein L30